MTSQSDYDRLLPFRSDLFPSFMSDQEKAAERIAVAIERCAGSGLDAIVDIGCGTGEILASVKRRWEARGGRPIRCIGVDCAEQEVSLSSMANLSVERAADFFRQLITSSVLRRVRRSLATFFTSSRS